MIAGIVASMLRRRATPPGELENIFTERNLGVLFYLGEKHPGEGGDLSDTEWLVTPVDAVNEADGSPYPGVMGQFHYDVGIVLKGGDGPITTASGWKVHYLSLPAGTGNTIQVIITNKEMMTSDGEMDPSTVDAINAWWEALGPRVLQLIDANGEVLYEGPCQNYIADPEAPLLNKGGQVPVTLWTQANRDLIKTIRLSPDIGTSNLFWATDPVDAVLNDTQDQPTATPYVDYMGRFSIDVDSTTSVSAAGGPITMTNGYKIHLVVRQIPGGSECDVYVSNKDHIDLDLSLDPATADAFDAWWVSRGPTKLDLISWGLDGSVAFQTKEAGKAAKVTIPDLYWPTDSKTMITSFRLAPIALPVD